MIDRTRLCGFTDEAAPSIDGQIAALKSLGWSGIELRTVDGLNVQDLDASRFDTVRAKLADNGIHTRCLGSSVANWNSSVKDPFDDTKRIVDTLLPRIEALGCHLVRVMSYRIEKDERGMIAPDQHFEERVRRLEWIVKEFASVGAEAVHENCFTYGGLSWKHTLQLVEAVPGLRLVFDMGNPPIDIDAETPFPYKMQDSWTFYQKVKDHIIHVHIKDSRINEKGEEEYFFPGEGHGDVVRVVTDLERSGYKGYYTMEPHMMTVFHDKSRSHSPEDCMSNFVEYGKRFERILDSI